MELRDFLANTFEELIEGIKKAQRYCEEAGGAVNPMGLIYPGNRIQHGETTRIVEEVEFDLEVIITEGSEKQGKAGLEVFSIGLGGGAGSYSENRSSNRIGFKVPVLFPRMKYEEDE